MSYHKRVAKFLGGANLASDRYQTDIKTTGNDENSNNNATMNTMPNFPYRANNDNDKKYDSDKIFEVVKENRNVVIFHPRNRRETSMEKRTDL